MRRFIPTIALALAAAMVSAACSGTSNHTAGRAARPAAEAASTTTTLPESAATTTTTSGPTTTTISPGDRARAAAAQAALDAYLRAVVGKNAKAVIAHSTGAAAALGSIRILIGQVDAASGATTTAKLENEAFHAQSITKTGVVLAGAVNVATDVHRPNGDQASVSNLSGPVNVPLIDRTWRVKDFVYDGKPLLYEGEFAKNAQGPVELNVGLVLSYANLTTALVALTAKKGQHVNLALTGATLTTAAGATPAVGSGFTKAAHPTGFIAFARTDALPTLLVASFRRPDGSTVTFTVPLTARPS